MASIAYITDKDMMEYHRLNGNKAINFWRPGSKRNISSLQKEDFVFFLAKTNNKKKERGIIGYGIFKEQKVMGIQRMWNQYTTQNGYATKEELRKAIERMSKIKEVPKEINCLWVEEIIFFQAPIYLSEFGVEISNRVESYIYVDKEDNQLTNKILKRGQEIGVDAWLASTVDDHNDEVIDKNRIAFLLAEIYERVFVEVFTEEEEKKLVKQMEALLSKRSYQEYDVIKGSQSVISRIKNQHIEIQFGFISPVRKAKEKLITLCGLISLFVELLNDKIKDWDIHVGILFFTNIPPELETLMEDTHIRYHYPMLV